jgi:DNA transformation protein and related proteins
MSQLRGIGPVSKRLLIAYGIESLEDLRRVDVFELYARIRQREGSASLNLLYALLGAQQDRDWRDVAREDRTMILMRLDDLGLMSDTASLRQRASRSRK